MTKLVFSQKGMPGRTHDVLILTARRNICLSTVFFQRPARVTFQFTTHLPVSCTAKQGRSWSKGWNVKGKQISKIG